MTRRRLTAVVVLACGAVMAVPSWGSVASCTGPIGPGTISGNVSAGAGAFSLRPSARWGRVPLSDSRVSGYGPGKRMPIQCPACSKVNPPDAQFCYYDEVTCPSGIYRLEFFGSRIDKQGYKVKEAELVHSYSLKESIIYAR